MGFYLKKKFKAGPVRVNLSEGGLGDATGSKEPQGGRVNAGREGLYYRKNLSKKKDAVSDIKGPEGLFFKILLVLLAITILYMIVRWLTAHPFISLMFAVLAGGGYWLFAKGKRKGDERFAALKKLYDDIFVRCSLPPEEEHLSRIRENKRELVRNEKMKARIEELEREVYAALIDHILEDESISREEKTLVEKLNGITDIDGAFKSKRSEEIYRLYYLDAVADRAISKRELEMLDDIVEVLGIDRSRIKNELSVVDEIRRAQELSLPLASIGEVPVKIPKSETAYYSSEGRVLTRRKVKEGPAPEYEYIVEREGPFVITDRRILVVSEGTDTVEMNEILDIDVDLDEGMIVISKETSTEPVLLQSHEPIYAGRIIDLLVAASRE